jgi:hypothetical protein
LILAIRRVVARAPRSWGDVGEAVARGLKKSMSVG